MPPSSDKAVALGEVLGQLKILVPAVADLAKKLDESDKAHHEKIDDTAKEIYNEIGKLREEITGLKVKLYWIVGILAAGGGGGALLGCF